MPRFRTRNSNNQRKIKRPKQKSEFCLGKCDPQVFEDSKPGPMGPEVFCMGCGRQLN